MAEDYKVIGVDTTNTAKIDNAQLDVFDTENGYDAVTGDGFDFNNALVVTNTDGEVIVIFIDAYNNINGTGNYEA